MGNIIGVKKEEKEADGDEGAGRVGADGEVDYKARRRRPAAQPLTSTAPAIAAKVGAVQRSAA